MFQKEPFGIPWRSGALKKKEASSPAQIAPSGSNRTERSIQDAQSVLGIGTTRELDRIASSLGLQQEAAPIFLHANNVCNAGALFVVPALLSQGLVKASTILLPLRKGYYGLMSVLLILAFMFLSRIKCPEQLKTCKVGELGKVIGLDRVPEAKCLREKIAEIVNQGKSDDLGVALCDEWLDPDELPILYIDGHVSVYHGGKANLPKRYVSREKLCLAGTTEFWVNDMFGLPYMVVRGELNEKLKDIILDQIVPQVLQQIGSRISQEQLDNDPHRARCIFVFDREGYDLGFFTLLWKTYRIAVLTYRKSVKDVWLEKDFAPAEIVVIGKTTTMHLLEKAWEHEKCSLREIRKLSESGHQTSIITTYRKETSSYLAGKMFSRWSQENFFRYMVQDFDLDRLAQHGVEEVNLDAQIVNPSYKKLTHRIKKLREKQARLKAKLFAQIEENLSTDIDALKKTMSQQAQLQESITNFTNDIKQLHTELASIPKHIKIKDMPVTDRYNKLKTESKPFMNTMKMIVYRSETVVAKPPEAERPESRRQGPVRIRDLTGTKIYAKNVSVTDRDSNLLSPHYAKAEEEIRMLIKEIIKSDADLSPDVTKKILTVRLHSLSTPRANESAKKLCEMLNETETIFPGTDLRLEYKTV